MRSFWLRRLAHSLLVIWGVLTLIFVILHLAPGDPLALYVRPDISPELLEKMRARFGFDQPLWHQYVTWLLAFVQLDFGVSFSHARPVASILAEALPATLQLSLTVFVLQFFAGGALGVYNAVHKGKKREKAVNGIMLFLYAMPGFWLALILVLIFSYKLGWLPSGQMVSLGVDDGFWPQLGDRLLHMVLPVTVLMVPFVAQTSRFMQEQMESILSQPYVRSARAFGFSQKTILYKYALRNALLPMISLFGLYFPFLLGGAVITEYIFAWPGVGRLMIEAVFANDYPLILAGCFIAALSVVTGNLLSDLLYRKADPRIGRKERYARG